MRKHNPRQLRVWIPDPRTVDDLGTIGEEDSMMNLPIFWRALWYLVLLAVLAFAIVLYAVTWSGDNALKEFRVGKGSSIWSGSNSDVNKTIGKEESKEELLLGVHPIEHMTTIATKHFRKMADNEIHTIEQAAAQYRKLRGRHPPPGFDGWYKHARAHNAIINERFWDQIYHDLAPFWSLKPVELRKQANAFLPKISIRNGNVKAQSHNRYSKLDLFNEMYEVLASEPGVNLPDIDIPLNINAEPAMLVPWESIDTLLSMTRKMMLDPRDVISKFSGLGNIEKITKDYAWEPEWLGPRLTHPSSHLGPRPLWSLVRPTCRSGSPARNSKVFDDIWDPEHETKDEHLAAALLPLDEFPAESLKGYVKNWTSATDACQHPNLQGLHSAFVSPKSMNIATKLFPLFSDTKLGVGNELLLPRAHDFHDSNISDPPMPWERREDKLYWRGKSTIAQDPQRYWRRFQTERLVSMLNATHIEIAEAAVHSGNESTVGVGHAKNLRLLPGNDYKLKTQHGARLADWVNGWADVGLIDLGCTGEDGCDEFFSIFPDNKGDDEKKAKFAISLDDDSFVSHLHNVKVTLRSSVYRQWYDARLVPWLHHIPLDNTLVDIYGVMEFFLGSHVDPNASEYPHAVGEIQKHEHHFKTPENLEYVSDSDEEHDHSGTKRHAQSFGRASHDDVARRIAEAGKEWADKVLRKEDMLIYVYRLVLEFARVVDDRRDRLGWVGDLL